MSNISYLVQSVDYSRSSWYVNVVVIWFLVSCYSHQKQVIFLECLPKFWGNYQQSLAKYDPVPTTPCGATMAIHHKQPDWNGVDHSFRSSGSVNIFRPCSVESFALFIFWFLLLSKDNGKGVSSYSKLFSTVISLWGIIISWLNNCTLNFTCMADATDFLSRFIYVPPYFGCCLSIDYIICNACESCWEGSHKQLFVTI